MRLRVTAGLAKGWHNSLNALGSIGELGPREAELVADTVRRGIVMNFEREQSPAGVKWTPLAKATQAERAKGIDERGIPFHVSPRHPILRRTGDLMESFTNPRHPRNVTQVGRWLGETVMVLGAEDDPKTPRRISRLHAGGFTDTMRYVPPRPFVGLSQRAVDQLGNTVTAVLRGRLERIGGESG